MTQAEINAVVYRLSFDENRLVFTGSPADPERTPPKPPFTMNCFAGKFYRNPNEELWYECKVSGSYTEMAAPYFEAINF